MKIFMVLILTFVLIGCINTTAPSSDVSISNGTADSSDSNVVQQPSSDQQAAASPAEDSCPLLTTELVAEVCEIQLTAPYRRLVQQEKGYSRSLGNCGSIAASKYEAGNQGEEIVGASYNRLKYETELREPIKEQIMRQGSSNSSFQEVSNIGDYAIIRVKFPEDDVADIDNKFESTSDQGTWYDLWFGKQGKYIINLNVWGSRIDGPEERNIPTCTLDEVKELAKRIEAQLG